MTSDTFSHQSLIGLQKNLDEQLLPQTEIPSSDKIFRDLPTVEFKDLENEELLTILDLGSLSLRPRNLTRMKYFKLEKIGAREVAPTMVIRWQKAGSLQNKVFYVLDVPKEIKNCNHASYKIKQGQAQAIDCFELDEIAKRCNAKRKFQKANLKESATLFLQHDNLYVQMLVDNAIKNSIITTLQSNAKKLLEQGGKKLLVDKTTGQEQFCYANKEDMYFCLTRLKKLRQDQTIVSLPKFVEDCYFTNCEFLKQKQKRQKEKIEVIQRVK